MKGAITGDIIGSHYEFQPCKEKSFLLFGDYYYYTDDTVLTLAIADAIINKESYEKCLLKWSRKYPDQSWGDRYNAWFRSDTQEPYNSFGNGSAMRVSPVGWAFNTLEETLLEAKKSAEVTHNHPEGVKGAQSVASAIFMARNKFSKQEIKDYVEKTFKYDLSRKYVEIQPNYTMDGSCQGSVPEAIICFLESTDFEDSVRNAIALGGDADTQACIAGSIAEAFYGEVPEKIWKKCELELDDEMTQLINQFYAFKTS
jgi:ADP-ribosylglycohydrolase